MRSNYQNGSRQQMAREQERDDRRKAELKRAAEKAAADAERKRLEMNGANFPVLGGGGWNTVEVTKPKAVAAVAPMFANMARDWKAADETQKILEETRRQAALRNERNLAVPVFIYRKRESAGTGQDWDTFEEVGMEEDPDQDWNNVTHRRKPKREITDAEIEEKYARSGSDNDDEEHNADLFEGRRRDYNCT